MSQFIIRVYVTSDAPWPVQLGADSACEMDGGPWGHTRKSEKDRECMREDKGWAGKESERERERESERNGDTECFQIQNSLVKWLLHPKILILSLIAYPYVVPNRRSFVRLRNTIEDILNENREACDCPID